MYLRIEEHAIMQTLANHESAAGLMPAFSG
jgi:hypothetical protein